MLEHDLKMQFCFSENQRENEKNTNWKNIQVSSTDAKNSLREPGFLLEGRAQSGHEQQTAAWCGSLLFHLSSYCKEPKVAWAS